MVEHLCDEECGDPTHPQDGRVVEEAAHLSDDDVKLLSVVTNSIAYAIETENLRPDGDPPFKISVPKERVEMYERAALRTIQHIDQFFGRTNVQRAERQSSAGGNERDLPWLIINDTSHVYGEFSTRAEAEKFVEEELIPGGNYGIYHREELGPKNVVDVDDEAFYDDAAAAEFYADPANRAAGPPVNESKLLRNRTKELVVEADDAEIIITLYPEERHIIEKAAEVDDLSVENFILRAVLLDTEALFRELYEQARLELQQLKKKSNHG